jgi:hypothetical protein
LGTGEKLQLDLVIPKIAPNNVRLGEIVPGPSASLYDGLKKLNLSVEYQDMGNSPL